MKYFYLIICLIVFENVAFSFENVVIPDSNIKYEQQSVISNEEIEALEKLILKKTYKTENVKSRLSRIEKEIFGMEQRGNEEERYENLLTASEYYKDGYRANENKAYKPEEPKYYTYEYSPKNYVQNYETTDTKPQRTEYYTYNGDEKKYYPQQTSKQKTSKVKQFLNDVIETFSAGAVTGYTPPMYYNGFDPLGGTTIVGYPQFPVYVRTPYTNYGRNYYPYSQRRYHSPYHARGYGYPHMPPPRNNYKVPGYSYTPYGSGVNNYGTGASIKIIN